MTSDAKRALDTATAIKSRLAINNKDFQICSDIYDTTPESLVGVLKKTPEHYKNLFLVGHNPELELLGYLLTQQTGGKFPTSAIMHLNLDISQWTDLEERCASLTLFDYPKQHATL